ncbi:SPFH domain-containing protein [Rhodoferax sp. TS-BS-61-7]|uniref:SPFH domain-containing protein n=1 Tax=Rhodoferax sp. TS-BS-61-7 TaxID=2094194 RepID=UPI0013751C61|nr:SPFH domain-containing protein [Rhodoferax sp. TS-BS-61-7]
MAQITRYPVFAHLRGEPNQYILHYSAGQITREGQGAAYWFRPLSASVAQVPVEDCSATFILAERSADFQEVSVQCTVVYRFQDPRLAASRINFSLSLATGQWVEDPLEKASRLWNQRARPAVRSYLATVPVADAIRTGPVALGHALGDSLGEDAELAAMGLRLVSVQVDQVTATPEVRKALETPTREAIQQKADEAVFERRALAVEKERAIKQNELSTEIELARRQDELIRQQGSNTLREVESASAAERARLDAELTRQKLVTESGVNDLKLKTEAEAAARKAMADAEATSTQLVGHANAASRRAMLDAETEAEIRGLAAWKDVSPEVVAALGFKSLSEKITKIGDVHLTPDLVGDWLGKLLKSKAVGALPRPAGGVKETDAA